MILLATGDAAGLIVGGWEYIWAAYISTWVFFGGYAISLYMRTKTSEETHD